jgi:L-asparaginase
MKREGLKRVLLIETGGTITMSIDERTGSLKPAYDVDALHAHVPELSKIAHVSSMSVVNVDSSNIQLAHWEKIARIVHESLSRFDGFVITHGTDTLVYTAAALSFMLRNLSKPVILTGSQLPLDQVGSDGKNNLINAFRLATMDIAEVSILFGSKVIRGTRAKKVSVFDLDAFESVNTRKLGSIGLEIRLYDHVVRRPKSSGRAKTVLDTRFNKNIFMLKLYPTMSPRIFDWLLEMSYSGIVLEAFGAGNVPSEENSVVPGIKRLVKAGVPVLVTSQCMLGYAPGGVYEPGLLAREAGAIPALFMTPETALVKLMWILGRTTAPDEVRKMVETDYTNEIEKM